MIETNSDSKELKNNNKSKIKVNDANDSEAVLTSSSQSLLSSSLSSKDEAESKPIETVLILQGGGSLGACGCGVFKALAKRNIRVDIVAGTSIGAVNAAIIAGGKDTRSSEQLLEQFWLELSESYVDWDNNNNVAFPFSYFLNLGLGGQ